MEGRYRVVVASPGLDTHDREAEAVVRALRDGGFEVVLAGGFGDPEQVAEVVVQEDADALGLAISPVGRPELVGSVVSCLERRDPDDVVVFASGSVPTDQREALERAGLDALFVGPLRPGEVAEWLERALDARGAEGASGGR